MESVCSDSLIAKKLVLERTKATAIVTNVTGKVSKNKLLDILRNENFSLIVDESTDRSNTKHLGIIVRTAGNFYVEDSFLCLLPLGDSTAAALYKNCVDFFQENNIPYKENMKGFASDGASVMFGRHHSLSTLFTKDIPNLILIKCVCHSFHLCASYACKKLPRYIEDFARDVYNYIQNSPKRFEEFKEFQDYVSIKPHKLLHLSQTRWLSLLPVVIRLLEKLPELKLFFQGAVFIYKVAAAKPILEKCLDPSTKLYLEFLRFVLPFFHDLIKKMQSEGPQLHILYQDIFTIYKSLLECFIKPEYLELNIEEKAWVQNWKKKF